MSCTIGWVHRAALGKSHWQQIGAVPPTDFICGVRIANVCMNRIVSTAYFDVVNGATERLRPKPPMYEPLLIPNRFERSRATLDENCQQEGRAERAETRLRCRGAVGIARIQRGVQLPKNERGEQISLEQCIDVDESAEVAAVSNVSPRLIELV